jgi:hypothetical protein
MQVSWSRKSVPGSHRHALFFEKLRENRLRFVSPGERRSIRYNGIPVILKNVRIKIVFVLYAKNYFFFAAAAFFTGFFASGFFAAAFFAAAMLVSTSYRKGLYFLLICLLINILVAMVF